MSISDCQISELLFPCRDWGSEFFLAGGVSWDEAADMEV